MAALGEGAFGKVHLATYKDGLEYFKDNQESSGQRRQQFVAVKELHGKYFSMFLLFFCLFVVVVVVSALSNSDFEDQNILIIVRR